MDAFTSSTASSAIASSSPPLPTQAVHEPLARTFFNEEQKDFIKAATCYAPLPYYSSLRNPVRHLLRQDFEEAPQSDLGLLKCFPPEILTAIILELDLTSCVCLRQTNRITRNLVTCVPEYRFVIENAFDFLGSVLRTGLGSWYTLDDVAQLLRQERCCLCDKFATTVFLPNWKKTCDHCRSESQLRVVSRNWVGKLLKMSNRRLQRLVPVMNVSSCGYSYYNPKHLLAVTSVKELCAKIEPAQPVELIHARLDDARDYIPVAYQVPFADDALGEVHCGMHCRGPLLAKREHHRANLCTVSSAYLFSAREFGAHMNSCPYTQRLRKTLEKSVDTADTKEGWVWVEVPRCGKEGELLA